MSAEYSLLPAPLLYGLFLVALVAIWDVTRVVKAVAIEKWTKR